MTPTRDTPFRVRDQTPGPSPSPFIRYRGGLGVAPAEGELTLKKKKSWFGSVKDIFQKSALQAKAAVDSVRGEQVVTKGDEGKQTIDDPDASTWSDRATPEPRDSIDSSASRTLLHHTNTRAPVLERRHTFSPKSAVSSLRQHLPGHAGRSKRESVHTITGRLSTDTTNPALAPAGPEQCTSLVVAEDEGTVPHRRKSSVAGSLVGSIRGLARRSTRTKGHPPTTDVVPGPTAETDAPAEEVPLPSSPINIPAAAPVLGLDLGESGMMMPKDFAGNLDRRQGSDPFAPVDVADPGKPKTHVPRTSLPHVPDEIRQNQTHPAVRKLDRPFAPTESLKLLTEPFKPSPSAAPTTPMPGTSLGMELDGAHDSGSSGKKSQVFERSVTPTTEHKRKELRTMRSLDAIADACKAEHRENADSAFAQPEPLRGDVWLQHATPSTVTPVRNPFASRRDNTLSSISTVSTCPLDMPQLERHESEGSAKYKFGADPDHGVKQSLSIPMPVDNPFDDTKAFAGGPPSPTRSVNLPFRPRLDDEAKAAEPLPVDDASDGVSEAQYISPEQTIEVQLQLQRDHAVAHSLAAMLDRPGTRVAPEHSTVVLEDDTFTRAQTLLDSDIVYPNYEYSIQSDGADDQDYDSGGDGGSPHGGPLGSMPLRHDRCSAESSGGSQSTWKAGLRDTFTFSFDTWRPGPQPIPEPQPLSLPNRRSMDVSIDSTTTSENWATPAGSTKTTTTADRTPSMGNKLDLDLKRSERNMRYNALQQEQADQKQRSSSPVYMHARFLVGGSSGDMDANEAQFFPDYPSAYISKEGTPEKDSYSVAQQRHRCRVGSEDSITMSLRSASDNMEKLCALLGDAETKQTSRAEDEEEIIDAFVTATSPSPRKSKLLARKKSRDLRSDSPSPEKHASEPVLEGTPKFSPTTARDNTSPNRFMVLEVETTGPDSSPSTDGKPSFEADFPASALHYTDENRVHSDDTLDRTLDMLSSPDSGYHADDSSDLVLSPATVLPERYRSQTRRRAARALGETSGNAR